MTSHSPAGSPELPDLGPVYIPDDQGPDDVRYVREDRAIAAVLEAGSAAAALTATQVLAGWISVDDERKPEGRKPILVAVQWMNHYEHEDGTPARQEGYDVTEGEYVPQHGERAGHFDSYAGPYDHDGWGITHWMHLPAAPTGEQA